MCTMKELPELEALVTLLREAIAQRTIRTVTTYGGRTKAKRALEAAKGQKIIDIVRHGRSVRFQLSRDAIIVGVSERGRFELSSKKPRLRDAQMTFELENGYFTLVDEACMALFVDKDHTRIEPVGVDPLTKQFNFAYFSRALKNDSRTIAQFLKDGTIVSGIGARYAAKIAKASGLNANVKIATLNKAKANTLFWTIKTVLRDAVLEKDPFAFEVEGLEESASSADKKKTRAENLRMPNARSFAQRRSNARA